MVGERILSNRNSNGANMKSNESRVSYASLSFLIAGLLGSVAVFGAISYLTLKSGPSPPELSTRSTAQEVSQRSEAEMQQELFNDQVVPAVREADLANRAAVERCLARTQASS